jgi:hypothetical protein
LFEFLNPIAPIGFLIQVVRESYAWWCKVKVEIENRMLRMPGQVEQKRVQSEEDDIFESTVNLEHSHLQQGYEDGFQDGVSLGKVEGREVGLKTGFELGEEIGFFRGCADLWNAVLQKDSTAFSARAIRNIRQFDLQLKSYPLQNPHDESLQESLDLLRVKFRAIKSMLSVHLDYEGSPKLSQAEESEF